MQNAWNKYGSENFKFEVVDVVSNPENLIKYEQLWMDLLKPEYNISKIAKSCLGVKRSEETRKKLSYPKTAIHKQRISESRLGSIPWNKGIPRTEFEKEAIRVGQQKTNRKGKLNPNSKLDDLIVMTIRNMYYSGKFSHRQLAKIFNVGKTTIGYIVRNETWKVL